MCPPQTHFYSPNGGAMLLIQAFEICFPTGKETEAPRAEKSVDNQLEIFCDPIGANWVVLRREN